MVQLNHYFSLTNIQTGMISTIYMIGQLIGSYSCGYLADKVNRMFVFKKTPLLLFFGGLIGSFSVSYWMILATCFIIGIGAGGEITLGPSVYS